MALIPPSPQAPARLAMAGFSITKVLELLAALIARQPVVGIDLVEVAPDYDRDGTTAILAAQLLLNLLGRILHAKSL